MDLNEIEADIQPGDFDHPLWRKLVEVCGPAALIVIAEYRQEHGERLYLPEYDFFVRGARKRDGERRLQSLLGV